MLLSEAHAALTCFTELFSSCSSFSLFLATEIVLAGQLGGLLLSMKQEPFTSRQAGSNTCLASASGSWHMLWWPAVHHKWCLFSTSYSEKAARLSSMLTCGGCRGPFQHMVWERDACKATLYTISGTHLVLKLAALL